MSQRKYLRLAGLLPIALFGVYFMSAYRQGVAANSLWMCHVALLLLGISLLLWNEWLIRASALWVIVGFPMWLYEMVRTGVWLVESVATHTVGLALGIAALRAVGATRRIWIPAFLMFVVLQLISRWFSPADLNVNLAHTVRPEWSWAIGSDAMFWWAMYGVMLVGLMMINKLLLSIFPQGAGDSRDTESAV